MGRTGPSTARRAKNWVLRHSRLVGALSGRLVHFAELHLFQLDLMSRLDEVDREN